MDNLSIEIRNKRVSRDKALKILKKKGFNAPEDDIDKFCKFVGISHKEFNKTCEKFRNKNIWSKANNKWIIKDFLISNWKF